jgi:hypothetical protein
MHAAITMRSASQRLDQTTQDWATPDHTHYTRLDYDTTQDWTTLEHTHKTRLRPHYTRLDFTRSHYTRLGYSRPHYTRLDYTRSHYTRLDHTRPHYTRLDYTWHYARLDYTWTHTQKTRLRPCWKCPQPSLAKPWYFKFQAHIYSRSRRFFCVRILGKHQNSLLLRHTRLTLSPCLLRWRHDPTFSKNHLETLPAPHPKLKLMWGKYYERKRCEGKSFEVTRQCEVR